MEDDLKFLLKGEDLICLKMEDNLKINSTKKQFKATIIIFLKMEDDLKFLEKGRRPQFF